MAYLPEVEAVAAQKTALAEDDVTWRAEMKFELNIGDRLGLTLTGNSDAALRLWP
jgi:hypothetical protein